MTETNPQIYLRTPALTPDGRRVAFVYAGDIWLVDVAGGAAERLTAHVASHRHPRFSPDGTLLAFTSGRNGSGDVYTMPLDGGSVQQHTFHDNYCAVEDWSAAGDAIYFSSSREQIGGALYRVDLAGGDPKPSYAEPFEQLGELSVSPDGAYVVFSNTRSRWSRRGPNPYLPDEIWLGPTDPDYNALRLLVGRSEALAAPYAGRNCCPNWAPDGVGIYFLSDRDGVENIWYQPLEGGPPQQVTRFRDGRMFFPSIARQSRSIVFERNWQIWQLDLDSGETAPIPIRVRTDVKYTPVRVEHWSRSFSELQVSPDGKKLAFVARGDIFVDFADKETDRELRQGPSFRVTDTPAREQQITWTPDSRSLVYISDRHGEDEVFHYDLAERQEARLTDDPVSKRVPQISPDGKYVAYVRGQDAIWLYDLATKTARELVRARFVFNADLAWSPDSSWLAFLAQDARYFSNVWVVPISGGAARQITFLSNISGHNLLWAPNGRFLIFTTEQYRAEAQIVRVDLRPPVPLFRETEFEKLFDSGPRPAEKVEVETPDAPLEKEPIEVETPETHPEGPAKQAMAEPAAEAEQEKPAAPAQLSDQIPEAPPEISFVGIERRLHFLTPAQMDAVAYDISPDSKNLLFLAQVAGKVNVWTLPLDEPRAGQPPRQITASDSHKGALQFTNDGKAFFYLDDGQITWRKFPSGNDITRPSVRAEVNVDFHQEKYQIFHEAWRLLRDSFYDPTFRGQDWLAVRDQFAPLVAGATSSQELHIVINLMVGELRASHLGSRFAGWSGNDGYLGILFDPVEQGRTGRWVVQRVIQDSPAALVDQPPQSGEELVAVDDAALGPAVSLDRLLKRSAGRRVRLSLRGRNGERRIDVRPVDADEYADLRYRDWVIANEDYVHRISNGRLGYVHIEEMSYGAYQRFLLDLDTEAHGKDGVIVDVRYNSGGHTATFILDLLARRSALRSGFREQLGVAMDAGHMAGNRILNKPTVLVTNERSMSNTEMLSESYRRLGLGRVVGQPTAGAVIWTYSARLLDGATLSLPRFFVITPEGEDLEGVGRPVDIAVERPLGEWARGHDRQLDAAVAALLGEADGTA